MPALLPLRDRAFTHNEFERLRMYLSTFQDGSGQLVQNKFMPDYLAFERATARVCRGATTENKGIFDLTVPGLSGQLPFGVSCKMTAVQPPSRPCWFMEMSNSSKKFLDAFDHWGIDWQKQPDFAGPVIVDVVESWHRAVQATVDLAGSRYLLLAHDRSWRNFEIACFDLSLRVVDPRREVRWVAEGMNGVVSSVAGYIDVDRKPHRLWQYFGRSGGQVKYYPPIGWERWRTGLFQLEPTSVKSLDDKVNEYYPGRYPHGD